MNNKRVRYHIVEWLKIQINDAKLNGFIVGVSGGIDSAITSTLCSLTELPVICLNMPIHQNKNQYNNSEQHIKWLESNFKNVESYIVDLTSSYNSIKDSLPQGIINELALANSRSRIRMIALYAMANSMNYLVAGTGNKVEDYGIGFFTKYGDGGVDISPIGDLLKSEVYELAKYLGIVDSIIEAEPNDGLWGDDRTDEDQIGATYDEIEWAMKYCKENSNIDISGFSKRQKEVMDIYLHRHNVNKHKMLPPTVCDLSHNK
jgi:NAD+ synthase